MKVAVLALLLTFASAAVGQQPSKTEAAPAPAQPAPAVQANPDDVKSMDAILHALYDVISGPAGKERDWNRMRSLFHPDARLIPTGKRPGETQARARVLTVDQYIERASPIFAKEGFYESEQSRKVEQFGAIAQVFSTYESRHAKEEKPFQRGINSIQLLNDGSRWWVMNVFWLAETPETPIPEQYLK